MKYKLTKSKCKELALLCSSKSEFSIRFSGAYNKSLRMGWHEELCEHMLSHGNRYNRCVYTYEFEDGSIYVGLTYNLDVRKYKHKIDRRSSVYQYLAKNNYKFIVKQLTDYITKEDAAKLESKIIKEHLESNVNLINRKRGGGLGGNTVKWTKERCLEVAKLSDSRDHFIKKYRGAYSSAKNNGWLVEIYVIIPNKTKPRGYWDKVKCWEVSTDYNTKSEFRKGHVSVYNIALRRGWLGDICDHMSKDGNKKYYWTKDRCFEISMGYKNRTSFRRDNQAAYKAAYKNGWLNELFPKT